MRKLDREHLKKVAWVLIGIALVVFVPYALAYTNIWWRPFHYVYVPPQPVQVPPPGSGMVYYAAFDIGEIPHGGFVS